MTSDERAKKAGYKTLGDSIRGERLEKVPASLTCDQVLKLLPVLVHTPRSISDRTQGAIAIHRLICLSCDKKHAELRAAD